MTLDPFDPENLRLTPTELARFRASRRPRHAADCVVREGGPCDCGLEEVLEEEAHAEAPDEVGDEIRAEEAAAEQALDFRLGDER